MQFKIIDSILQFLFTSEEWKVAIFCTTHIFTYNLTFFIGLTTHCLDQHTQQLCIDIPRPEPSTFLSFIWPKSQEHSNGYCQCYPTLSYFPECLRSCVSNYQIFLSGRQICLHINTISRLLQRRENLKAFFIATENGANDAFSIFSFYGYLISGKG